ncbi:enoyl-CoA hydratase/isomerase family protein [Micromonospora inyonensis]|uniref:enoyl-CoA hydratase n=1 Tax=Micromonospora inyonensis TaxID=47866 RepID=A0A1C6SD86_9ACTN|nr:enoyl-CoA hydratase-related protein [Micromonospora inyonensis]SCL27464.1 enoyl-CoA hydratase [Micromonospora inyonensis]
MPEKTTEFDTVAVVRDGAIATVTINRPEVRNALGPDVQADLRSTLELVGGDDDVRAVIFTGAGDRAFAAGADINRLRDYDRQTALRSNLQRLLDDIETLEKPTIAAVNGFALGGGCELAMACDIRVASKTARFGLPETALGIVPGAGGTQRLTRLVGVGVSLDLILTGRLLTALEALQFGLISRVTDPGSLMSECREIATAILARGPLAVRLAKLVVRSGSDTDMRSAQVIERLAQAVLYETTDKVEGVEAFLEKRPAKFEGR